MLTDPFAQFDTWLAEAARTEPNDPNAMTLATATPDGRPSARMVLLKGADRGGFVFYTNTQSRKGGELAANQAVALLFHWKTLTRQVRIEGRSSPVNPAEADAYYASRARVSRLGAWASEPIPSAGQAGGPWRRAWQRWKRAFRTTTSPRPPHWSGFRVRPDSFEFWQDMPYRLHDRTVFTRAGEGWTTEKLYP